MRTRALLLRCTALRTRARAASCRCLYVRGNGGVSSGTTLARHLSIAPVDSGSSIDAVHPSLRLSPPYPPTNNTTASTDAHDAAEPLTVEEFSTLLNHCGIPPTQQVAIGLSGGADSTTLALLAHHEALQPHSRRPPPLLLQVDHQLRPESKAETQHSSHWISCLPHSHSLQPPHNCTSHVVLPLRWDGVPAVNRVQEVARERRRGVLVAECVARRVGWLLFAHHVGDQLETVVHRWTRGSGLYGLTGMAQRRTVSVSNGGSESADRHEGDEETIEAEEDTQRQEREKEVVICRPLLGVSKARLIATCRQYGVRWVEDISNTNRAFERIRIRQALTALTTNQPPHLPPLTATLLASVPAILASCQQSVHAITTLLLRRHATLVSPFGVCFVSARVLGVGVGGVPAASFPVVLALFSRVLAVVRGSVHLPMGEPLPQIVRSLMRGGEAHSGPVTNRQLVFGCVISSFKGDGNGQPGGWMIARATDHTTTLPIPTTRTTSPTLHHLHWDNRFLVTFTLPPTTATSHPSQAGYNRFDYALRLLRKEDVSLFELPVPTVDVRRLLLTGLPVLVRRWTKAGYGSGGGGESEVGESCEDVVLVPHAPLLWLKGAGWDETERVRREGDRLIQVTVTRLEDRVSKWDWTQRDDNEDDAYKQTR